MRWKRTRRAGAVLLEAALIMPVLLLLTFGLMELGYFFYVQHGLTDAARAGARAGIRSDSGTAAVTDAVAQVMGSMGFVNSQYSVGIDTTPPNIVVTVRCNWGAVGLRPLGILNGSVSVQGVAVMRRE